VPERPAQAAFPLRKAAPHCAKSETAVAGEECRLAEAASGAKLDLSPMDSARHRPDSLPSKLGGIAFNRENCHSGVSF
jgi:hypothetical protein